MRVDICMFFLIFKLYAVIFKYLHILHIAYIYTPYFIDSDCQFTTRQDSSTHSKRVKGMY
jgi:hypothetical protein